MPSACPCDVGETTNAAWHGCVVDVDGGKVVSKDVAYALFRWLPVTLGGDAARIGGGFVDVDDGRVVSEDSSRMLFGFCACDIGRRRMIASWLCRR